MPVMDGFEAIRTIRSLPGGKEVKIFAITASVFEEDRQNILESGADEFIKKPFKEYEIFEKISDCLGIRFVSQPVDPDIEKMKTGDRLTREMISTLPNKIKEQIKEAIINGDIESMESIILKLTSRHKTIADQLLSLAKNFNFERLYQLFEIT
jgi:DNA-binding response OmpR family regulator